MSLLLIIGGTCKVVANNKLQRIAKSDAIFAVQKYAPLLAIAEL